MVMMEQCHSGGFQSAVINNSTADETSFAAACVECNSSRGGPEFDPFAKDWISAATGVDPYEASLDYDPDRDEDGLISAKEAFDYAYAVKDSYDTPIYSDKPQGCGDDMILGHPPLQIYWGAILKYIGFERHVIKEIQEILEPKIPSKPPRPEPDPLYQYDQILRRTSKLDKIIRTQYKY